MASFSDQLKTNVRETKLVVVLHFDYHWLSLLISGTIEFSPVILTFTFLFNSPLFDEFDQTKNGPSLGVICFT